MSTLNFVQANWENLLVMNFEVNPAHLQAYLPKGVVLDLWKGKCLVSLVGFRFNNMKCLQIPAYSMRNFDEVNLRFYVKEPNSDGSFKRGVVFIKELVPDKPLAVLANTLFNEHYESVPLEHRFEEFEEEYGVCYNWEKGDRTHSMEVRVEREAIELEEGSEEEFTLEHYFGYTKISDEKTYRYEVKHPKWEVYKVQQYALNWNPRLAYGEEWKFLRNIKPRKVMLAKGSSVSVHWRERI